MKNKIVTTLIMYFSIVTVVIAEPIPLPSLTISSNNSLVSSGGNIMIIATVSGWDEQKWGMPASSLFSGVRLINGHNYDEFDNTSPYEWNISYPIDYAGVETYRAIMLFGTDYISSNEITITVKPDLSSLDNLRYKDGEAIVISQGDFEQLRVLGLFSDGQERDITLNQLGTVYSENIVNGATITSGNSPVISVSTDGLLTAEQPGEAEVVATNNGKVAIRRIKVVAVAKPTNQAPVAVADTATTLKDTAVTTGNVLLNDTDADGDTLSVSTADTASTEGGVIVNHNDGTFTYTPKAEFIGTDTFTYTVSDGKGGTDVGTVTITVTEPAIIPGDANADGKINSQDLIKIINHILGIETANGNPDCNSDGSVNSLDTVCIINKILGT